MTVANHNVTQFMSEILVYKHHTWTIIINELNELVLYGVFILYYKLCTIQHRTM